MRYGYCMGEESHVDQDQARRTYGQRAADRVTRAFGSWWFIIVQTITVSAWLTANIIAWSYRWDIYPFILLNLAFSTQSAFAAPLILLSQNRKAEHDRRIAEHDYTVNKEDAEINRRTLVAIARMHSDYMLISDQQLRMLEEIRGYMRGELP